MQPNPNDRAQLSGTDQNHSARDEREALDATQLLGVRGEVSALINMLDGNPERIREEIRQMSAIDETFKRHWLAILEVAADYRERDISAAYRIWKNIDPIVSDDSPDLSALDPVSLTTDERAPVADFKDSKDMRAWRLFHNHNNS